MTHHYIYLREQTAFLDDFRIKNPFWKYWFLIGLDMVIDSNSILSRVPPPGAVPVSLSEAAHMWSNEITSRNVSLVGMVVKIKAPNQSKTEPKVKKGSKFFARQNRQKNLKFQILEIHPTHSLSTLFPWHSSSTQLTLSLEMVNHLMDIRSVNIWFKSKMGFWIDRLGDIRLNPQVAKGRTRRICCCSSCYAYRKVCIFSKIILMTDFEKDRA